MLGRIPAHLGTVIVGRDSSTMARGMARLILAALVLITLAVGWYAAQVALLNWQQPRSLGSSLSQVQGPLYPDTPIQITLQGYGAELGPVQLFRSDPMATDQEQPVPVRAV